jgi:hypothetical protein
MVSLPYVHGGLHTPGDGSFPANPDQLSSPHPSTAGVSTSQQQAAQQALYRGISRGARNNDASEEEEVNVPHKPRRLEAFKKKAPARIKKVQKVQTSKSFPNSKFQKILDRGVAEMQDYDRLHKESNVYESTKKLKKDYVSTLRHLEYQLKI